MTRTKKYVARMRVSPRVIRLEYVLGEAGLRAARTGIIYDMTRDEIQRLLADVKSGAVDSSAAAGRLLDALRAAPFEDLGFARVDTHREVRQGFPEVILGAGKPPDRI